MNYLSNWTETVQVYVLPQGRHNGMSRIFGTLVHPSKNISTAV